MGADSLASWLDWLIATCLERLSANVVKFCEPENKLGVSVHRELEEKKSSRKEVTSRLDCYGKVMYRKKFRRISFIVYVF